MATPRALVLRTAGTNCDRETQYALELAGFEAQCVHILRITENPALLDETQLLVLPGGFSYGDDVAAGKILANQLMHHLAEPLTRFVQAGKLVLGICNGFQVLLKSGLLPWAKVDPAAANRDATLGWNDCGQFVNRWVHLRANSDKCVFIGKGEVISLPIAHGEGKFVPRDNSVLETLRAGDQVALRYCDAADNTGGDKANPNGSIDDIAALCDPSGRVLGLMPQPERFVTATQHPTWTRGNGRSLDGLRLFQRAKQALS
ncbi:MAG: phosphoribosylformylglycinamidine synthase I [Planctomycetes bacterium]|nr:phosphoribosylformylglycinamidine synthase I [Planctomycetota bacterium]